MPDHKWITIELLDDMDAEAEGHPSRLTYLKNVKRGWKWYKKRGGLAPMGEFDDEEIDPRHATSRDNVIKEAVDELGGLFLKNNPIVRTYPQPGHPEDGKLADDMDAIRLATWRDVGVPAVLASMLKESMIAGLSTGKVYWDYSNKIKNNKGEVAIVKLSPKDVFFDPFATNDHRALDCRYIIHRTKQPIAILLQRYGDDAAVALGLRDSRGRAAKYSRIVGRYLNMSREKLVRYLLGPGAVADGEQVDDSEEVREYWIFPITSGESDLVLGKKIEDDGYPFGVVVTRILDHIVKVKANPFSSVKKRSTRTEEGFKTETLRIGSQRHPFVPMYWARDADEDSNNTIYECMGIVEPMIPMQSSIDRLRRNIEINARTLANPGGLVNEDAFEFPMEQMTMGPSELMAVKDGFSFDEALRLHDGKQLPQYVFELLVHTEANIKQRIGIRPGVTSLSPLPGGTSHTPAMTIGALQQAAFTPLWPYVKEVDMTVHDISVLMDGLIQQFYTEGRFVDVSSEGSRRYVEWTNKHITANFRREVVAGTTTPIHDIERGQKLAEIASVTNEALLSNNPDLVQSTVYYLRNLRNPDAYDWMQLLEEKLESLKQQAQEMQQIGLQGLQQQALPQEGQEADFSDEEVSGLESFSEETGMTPEQILMSLEQ